MFNFENHQEKKSMINNPENNLRRSKYLFLNEYDSRSDEEKTDELSHLYLLLRESYWEIDRLNDIIKKLIENEKFT